MGLLLAVVVTAGFAVTAQAGTAGTASHGGGGNRRSADVTFTKWVTSLPEDPSTFAGVSMDGVVGGDVGSGTFSGMVVSDDTTSRPGFWLAQALYGFIGGKRSFVAHNLITENDTASPITATIRGLVISGWMMGAHVTGEYTLLDPCPIPTPDNVLGTACFQGTLHLQLG
jgi:hypothetical protein